MKTGAKIGIAVAAVVVLAIIGSCSFYTTTYNNIVAQSETVDSSWAQVENQYQRRYDLIPNLVATVKGYAAHEADVLAQVTEARSRAGGVLNVSDDILNDPEAFRRFQDAQSELGSALQRLLVVSENYPELKANENFLALQDQLEGTENRIAVERNRFNEAVRNYNSYIRRIPQMWIAGMAGFRQKAYFTADSRAQNAPTVSF
jgi:LemA protein